MKKSDWYEKGELPPAGTEVEFSPAGVMWREVLFIGITSRGKILLEFKDGGINSYSQGYYELRPISEPKKINMCEFYGSGVLYVQDKDILTLNFHIAEHPHWGHWNAVKYLTEEPEWCKGFNVTVRLIDNREEVGGPHTDWNYVVAIRFDGVEDGWEL